MSESPQSAPRPQDDLTNGFLVSMVVHLLIVLVFTVRLVFFPSDDTAALPAIRVDLVALPDKVAPVQMPKPAEPNEPEATAPPAPEPTPAAPPAPPKVAEAKPTPVKPKPEPEAINLEKAKAKQQAALSKLKSMDALDKIEKDLERERSEAERKRLEALAAAARTQAGAVKIKGNQVAPGSSLTGIERLEHESYKGDLDRHIKQFWSLPEWIARKKLRAMVLVKIDNKGRLLSKRLTQPSGDSSFDDSVMLTIDQSAPLPAPPEKFVAKVAIEGILIEFGEESSQ